MAPSILAGASSRANVSNEWMKTAIAVLGTSLVAGSMGIGVGIGAISSWLAKTVSGTKKKSKRG